MHVLTQYLFLLLTAKSRLFRKQNQDKQFLLKFYLFISMFWIHPLQQYLYLPQRNNL